MDGCTCAYAHVCWCAYVPGACGVQCVPSVRGALLLARAAAEEEGGWRDWGGGVGGEALSCLPRFCRVSRPFRRVGKPLLRDRVGGVFANAGAALARVMVMVSAFISGYDLSRGETHDPVLLI